MLDRLTRLKFILLFALAQSLTSAAQAEKLPAVVALFGDSITVGYLPPGSPDKPGGFLDRFANGTTERGDPTKMLIAHLGNGVPERPAIVTNWGIGGTASGPGDNGASYHGLGRINSALATAKSTHEGSQYLVLILYGSNDFGVGIDTATTRNNIEAMIEIARSRGFTPIIGNLIPRSDYNLGSYNSAIASAASNKNAPLVDHYSSFINFPNYSNVLLHLEESVTKPGVFIRLHPRVQGYQVIADNWFNTQLKNLVATAIPPTPYLGAISLLLLDDAPPPP